MNLIYVLTGFVLISLLLFTITFIFYCLICAKISENSPALLRLSALNHDLKRSLISDYSHPVRISISYKSKGQYDKHTIEQAFLDYISDHKGTYFQLYSSLLNDQDAYENYLCECVRIRSLFEGKRDHSLINQKLEKQLFNKNKLPRPERKFIVTKSYTSPKGKKHYRSSATFSTVTFLSFSDKLFKNEQNHIAAALERSLMNQTLRYQILLRDGFRCKICGRGSKDGAVLQIDHIRPVSKGGKTVPSNLRTLCRECNLGKSDFYDPTGNN